MKIICAWCDKVLKEGVVSENGFASHGICPECKAILQKELDGATKLVSELCHER